MGISISTDRDYKISTKNRYNQFIQAIQSSPVESNKQLQIIKKCVEAGCSINHTGVSGHSPLFLTVTLERKEIFDYFLTLTEFNPDIQNGSNETVLHLSLRCTDTYFTEKLLQYGINLNQKMYKQILHLATDTNNSTNYENVRLVEKLIKSGADINYFNLMGVTPLDSAIENDDLEMVCMYLYYNSPAEYFNNTMSSFIYSIIARSSKEIQLTLLNYIMDINETYNGMSMIFLAIKHSSPIIEEIISRGADLHFVSEFHNIISLLMNHPCEPHIFKLIWDKFDYSVWINTFSKSVLLRVLENSNLTNDYWTKYLSIIIESDKIQEILEAHYSSYFADCDYLMSNIYFQHTTRGLEESHMFPQICILLTYGAKVYESDIIFIYKTYNRSFDESKVLHLLLSMDIEEDDELYQFTFARAKYSIKKNISEILAPLYDDVLNIVCLNSLVEAIQYFSFPPELKEILITCGDITVRGFARSCNLVPSLLEIARNQAKVHICKKYNITKCHQYYTIVNYLVLPKLFKEILKFEKPLYILHLD